MSLPAISLRLSIALHPHQASEYSKHTFLPEQKWRCTVSFSEAATSNLWLSNHLVPELTLPSFRLEDWVQALHIQAAILMIPTSHPIWQS